MAYEISSECTQNVVAANLYVLQRLLALAKRSMISMLKSALIAVFAQMSARLTLSQRNQRLYV